MASNNNNCELVELSELEPSTFLKQYTFALSPYSNGWESEVFGLKKGLWKIVAIPHETTQTLGVYLECVWDHKEEEKWSCSISGLIRIRNYFSVFAQVNKHPSFFTFNYTSVERTKKIGFDEFIKLQELFDPQNGWMYNGKMTLEVSIIVDFDKSKLRNIGCYKGLHNNGASCYMSVALQIVFHTNILRRAVYQIPTENNDAMSFCLQQIYFELQFKSERVGIKEFIYLCEGCTTYSQEDATESLRNLRNKLDDRLRNTIHKELISDLFKGNSISYIRCTDTEYVSAHSMPYYDIQLNIHGLNDLEAAFDEYVRSELLAGENRYDTGEYGLQTAYKGLIFATYPPILQLQLLRFNYNYNLNRSFKNNSRFEFPETINLDKYLLEPEAEVFGDYLLYAVVVHSGELNCGHYVVFINPKADGRWIKFDDDSATECSKQEAIDDNFGGKIDAQGFPCTRSAYMLVYMRKSEVSRILVDITEDDVDYNLAVRIKLQQALDYLKLQIPQVEAISIFNVNWPKSTENKIVNKIGNGLTTESDMKFLQIISIMSQLINNNCNINDGVALSNTLKFKMLWISDDLKTQKKIIVLMGINDTVKVLLKMAINYITFIKKTKTEMRLLQIENHKIVEICKEDTLIKSLIDSEQSAITTTATTTSEVDTKPTYRIEEVPADQLNFTIFELLLPVFHFKKNISNTFGVPFLIKVQSYELYSDVKKRMQKRLNMADEEWNKLNLYLAINDICIQVEDHAKITNSVFKLFFEGQMLPSLGLKHPSE